MRPHHLYGVIICLVAAFVLFVFFFGSSGPGAPSNQTTILTPDQIKNQSVNASFDDLMIHSDVYKGKIVHIRGNVMQVSDKGSNNSVLRIFTGASGKNPGSYPGNDILAYYTGQDIHDSDLIDVWGYYNGLDSANLQGGLGTVPAVDAILVNVASKTEPALQPVKPVQPAPRPGRYETVPERGLQSCSRNLTSNSLTCS